jgi:hypothetical protein
LKTSPVMTMPSMPVSASSAIEKNSRRARAVTSTLIPRSADGMITAAMPETRTRISAFRGSMK